MSARIAIANITLNTLSIGRQDFASMMFAAKHNYFQERAKFYTSTDSVLADGIPDTSSVYKAVELATMQDDRPLGVWIGRIESESQLALTDATPVVGKTYGLTITAKDAAIDGVFTHTAAGGDTAETAMTQLKAGIDGDAGVSAVVEATIVGTGNDAKLVLSHRTAGEWFVVKDFVNTVDEGGSAEETGTVAYQGLKDSGADFYYLTAEEKDGVFVKQVAAAVEVDELRFYRVSLAETEMYASALGGTYKDLKDLNYFRTYAEYHHLAESDFPEVAATAELINKVTGRITFANRQPKGVVQAAKVDGSALSDTDWAYLAQNRVPTYARVAITGAVQNLVITTQGKVVSGEHAANIPARDNMKVDLEARLTTLLLSQFNGRVSYTKEDLLAVKAAVIGVLDDYFDPNDHDFINADFKVYVPEVADISDDDKANNVLTGVSFSATLKGAIHMITLNGVLTLS